MRWFNLVGSLTALLVGLSVPGQGFAQPPFGGPPPEGGPGSFATPPPGGGPGPFAGPPPGGGRGRFGGPGPGPDRFVAEYAAELGLDDETVGAIDKIVDQSREETRALRAKLRGMHREMRDLLSQDTPDESAVMQQAEAIGKVETEIHKHRLGALIGIRALLTEEQRAELSQIREETRAQWRQPLLDACEADIDGLCPDADDPWSRRGCARAHWEELSSDCQNAIEAAMARRGHHHRGMRHGRPGMGDEF
jgi:Spy/CpxP family protein refolding chaperone